MNEDVMSTLLSELSQNTPSAIQDIRSDSHLKDDLGIDSLDLVEITVQLETLFQVQFRPEDLDGIKTVGDLLNRLLTLLQIER